MKQTTAVRTKACVALTIATLASSAAFAEEATTAWVDIRVVTNGGANSADVRTAIVATLEDAGYTVIKLTTRPTKGVVLSGKIEVTTVDDSAVVSGSIRVVDLVSGAILASETWESDQDDLKARVASMLVEAKLVATQPAWITIRVAYSSFGTLSKFKSALKTMAGVTEAHQRRASEGEALVEVKTSLSAAQLSEKLAQAKGRTSRVVDGHVRVTLAK